MYGSEKEEVAEYWSALCSSRYSTVGKATGNWLHGRGSEVRFPAEARNVSILHSVHTGCGAHPVSYSMGIGFSFLPRGKAAEE
jgi:hypothetical protein